MKLKAIFLIILVLLFFINCDNEPTKPKDNPYRQQPIDWPSLADSPWPMYRHDPQNTGRSPYSGAFSGIIVDKIPSYNSQAGVVVSNDSTLYFYNGIPGEYFLQATDFSGNLKWSKRVDMEPSTTPVVLYDGSIVAIGLETGEFICLTAVGDTLWQCFVDVEWPFPWAVNPGLTVGLDTTIYYITGDRCLVAISKEGELKWTLTDERFSVEYTNMPAFSPDGRTLYVNGDNGVTLLAIDLATRSVKWTYGNIPLNNSLIVDNQGNIFVNNGYPAGQIYSDTCDFSFFSLNPAGTLRWQYTIARRWAYQIDPTIDWDGNVYFITDTLYSFFNNGEMRWKIPLKSYVWNPLICDDNDNIYYMRNDDESGFKSYCINKSSEIVWAIENSSEHLVPGITPIVVNNRIFIPDWGGKWIYIIF